MLEVRKNAEEEFTKIFADASKISNNIFSIPITKPRINKRQNSRENHAAETPEEYHRVAFCVYLWTPLEKNPGYVTGKISIRSLKNLIKPFWHYR